MSRWCAEVCIKEELEAEVAATRELYYQRGDYIDELHAEVKRLRKLIYDAYKLGQDDAEYYGNVYRDKEQVMEALKEST